MTLKDIRLVSQPFSRPGADTIMAVSCMHFCQVALMAAQSESIGATNLLAIIKAVEFLAPSFGRAGLMALMCFTASIAVIGALVRVGRPRFMCFGPQNLILGAMAWGGAMAMWQGAYLDGTLIPWGHIGADQIGYMVLLGLHWRAIRKRCKAADE